MAGVCVRAGVWVARLRDPAHVKCIRYAFVESRVRLATHRCLAKANVAMKLKWKNGIDGSKLLWELMSSVNG